MFLVDLSRYNTLGEKVNFCVSEFVEQAASQSGCLLSYKKRKGNTVGLQGSMSEAEEFGSPRSI